MYWEIQEIRRRPSPLDGSDLSLHRHQHWSPTAWVPPMGGSVGLFAAPPAGAVTAKQYALWNSRLNLMTFSIIQKMYCKKTTHFYPWVNVETHTRSLRINGWLGEKCTMDPSKARPQRCKDWGLITETICCPIDSLYQGLDTKYRCFAFTANYLRKYKENVHSDLWKWRML